MASKPKIRLAGFVTTDAYLTVHFTTHWQTTARYMEVKVPMADLARDVQFGTAFDRTMGRLLKSYWELDAPLEFVDDENATDGPPWRECSDTCRCQEGADKST